MNAERISKHLIIKFAKNASQETGLLLCIGRTPEVGRSPADNEIQNSLSMGREFVIFVTGRVHRLSLTAASQHPLKDDLRQL